MRIEYANTFLCPNCEYTESLPADQQRHHMSIELVDLGESETEYALYKCVCGVQSWSFVESYQTED